MKKIFLITLCFILCFSTNTWGRVIKGIVTDANDLNENIVGAYVSVVGGKKGTITDIKGTFTLEVSDNDKQIIIGYLGYISQRINIGNGNNFYTIKLQQKNNTLNEAVVTGYQKIDRRKLTAAVSKIKINDETVGAVKNIDQALAGQIAGLSSVTSNGAPGAPVKIRIRGTASINGTQDPLWVVDGIPLEGTDIPKMEELKDIDEIYQTSIAGINPADIEDITVLKDAAATAIYGARAANGVIVITTKKGKAGKTNVNFSAKFSYEPKPNIDRLNLLNSNQKVDLELQLLQSNYDYRENKGGVAQILNDFNEINVFKKEGWGAISPDAQKAINNLRRINTDWNDILFRSVLNQEYNFSISGGNERSTFYTSIGYYDEQGTTKSVDNKRLNLTLKVDYKINKILKLGASVFANERKQNNYLTDFDGFTNPVYYSRLANPYQKVYDEEGNYIYDTNVQGKETTDYDFNIFEERRNTSNIRKDRSVLALFEGELKPIEDLKITSQFGLQYDGYNITKYAGENSYAMRKTYKNALYGGESFLPQGGMNKVTDYHSKGWTWKAMAEYNKAFNDIHELNVMLGTEVRHTQYNAITSTAYGYDAYTKTSQPVIFPKESLGESYPLYNETYMENAFVSWFATASYTYKYRYTLGGSVRFDGSDVFGVAKKYRYLPLYSVSGLWRINKEKFMRPIKWVNNLSIRASYGLQGNIDKNTSPYLIGIYKKQTILPDNIQRVIQAETAPNPSLKWEKTQNVNIGFDLAILNNAITLGLDYYYRRSSDLIGMKMLPLETGFSSTVINWAEMENRGFEVALATRNISTRKFRWTTNINLGFNSNKILHETVAENTTYPSREGYSVGAIFAYKTAGLDEGGYPFFVTKDGQKLSAADFFNLNNSGASQLTPEEQRAQFTYMGTSDPKVSGGFINTIEFGRFQFNMNWTFNLGMTVRVQPTYSCTNYDRGLNTNTDILSRWTSTNTNASFPVLMTSKDGRTQEYARYTDYGGTSNPYNMLDIWVKDCDYFRLTSLRVGYKLPDIWMKNLKISSVSVSMEVRNLFVISSNYDNYLDPETMGNPYAQPLPKTVIFGINVNF